MTNKPGKIPTWPAEPLPERLKKCVSLLVHHDILPPYQRDAAMTRIVRRFIIEPKVEISAEARDLDAIKAHCEPK